MQCKLSSASNAAVDLFDVGVTWPVGVCKLSVRGGIPNLDIGTMDLGKPACLTAVQTKGINKRWTKPSTKPPIVMKLAGILN
jgi:hypothetical protein